MTRIVFLDTETTELRDDREIWEIGLIVRDPGVVDREIQMIVTDADFSWANPVSLRIGGAYDRHPKFMTGKPDRKADYVSQDVAAQRLEAATRGATIVGLVPDFDTSGAKNLLRRNGYPWAGHYQLVDAENLIVGHLKGQRAAGLDVPDPGLPPWRSEPLSRLIGIEPPDEVDRHTALGDARWARAIWDRVMSGIRLMPEAQASGAA